MLRIPTRLGPSAIPGAGLGLFAAERVPAGTLVWRLDPGADVALDALPGDPVRRRFVEVYGYVPLDGPERWVVCLDDGRFINHADAPNTTDDADTTVAARDIEAGEEITSDYRAFCRTPFAGWSPYAATPDAAPPGRATAAAGGGGARARVLEVAAPEGR